MTDDEVAFAERVERLALQGAHFDSRPDKTDWIRMWAAARDRLGKPTGPDAWEAAVRFDQGKV